MPLVATRRHARARPVIDPASERPTVGRSGPNHGGVTTPGGRPQRDRPVRPGSAQEDTVAVTGDAQEHRRHVPVAAQGLLFDDDLPS